MRKLFVILLLFTTVFFLTSFNKESLRTIYSRPASAWPEPTIDEGIEWTELGLLPESPIASGKDSLKEIIELGKVLFFDTRLSGSGKISCASCHQPELNWTDGKEKSLGHEGTLNKRNAPTIQNSWFYKRLFWDGRSTSLQDQAFSPINSESEMHSEMPDVIRKLRASKGYRQLFFKAFGNNNIDPDNMTEAIATFEKTILSRRSRFDEFLAGNTRALTNKELKGLHLFRTKARCMNCHNGPFFSDNQFHNNGFHLNDNPNNDKGLYSVTRNEEDIGKFKTPSLRDVMKTSPWMHNGLQTSMQCIITAYNKRSPVPKITSTRILNLTSKEQSALLAFLIAISSAPLEFEKPVLPE